MARFNQSEHALFMRYVIIFVGQVFKKLHSNYGGTDTSDQEVLTNGKRPKVKYYYNEQCAICISLDSALITDYVPTEETRQTLSRYLSKLTFSEDGSEICLPEENTPEGFHLIHNRCSKRSMYEISPGYPIILSKESSWESDVSTEMSRESVVNDSIFE